MALIDVRNLTKVFYPARPFGQWIRCPWRRGSPIPALQNLSLMVQAGEAVCVMGTNGAGKTTLLKMLVGLILPTAGEVLIGGRPVSRDTRWVHEQVGFASGDRPGFYDRLTGRQNLLFFAALQGLPRARALRRVEEALDAMEIGHPDQQYQEYSAGMKQRLLLCRSLLHEPRILVLDEPGKSLDPVQSGKLHALIADRLRRVAGTTILWTTHHLQEAERLAGRIAVLHRGMLRFVGPPEELRRAGGLEELCRG